ncbi:NAD(P)H-dependent oxidoreductase [Maricaulis sp. D1M11]|uniref:NAD(P)H-dependent oxidoreductase n=1 Tax=Maricaulis sp. D1M11 TaxID=3076117 RepID=UPI0039B5B284
MARILLYYAHPGHRFSHANKAMWARAHNLSGITCVDLYAEYPRFQIDVETEQERLLNHDIIIFQCPFFWYSTPALIKEWFDLVLEHGFAYGKGGDKLAGKSMMMALTAAGTEEAYTEQGYQHYPLRTFLTPIEQTARLSKMSFLPPYVLYGSLKAVPAGEIEPHAAAYARLLTALRDDTFDTSRAQDLDVLEHTNLPIRGEG